MIRRGAAPAAIGIGLVAALTDNVPRAGALIVLLLPARDGSVTFREAR